MDWRVSAIIPVYNGAGFITEALDSIVAQTRPAAEIIVIDDGSTDETAQIVETYPAPIRYIHQDNQGPQHARNRGIAMASGDAIAFLDADDCWQADKLKLQANLLESADVVIGNTIIMDAPDGVPFILPSLCCSMIRAACFDRIGAFDPQLEYSDDMDWYLRAREEGLRMAVHDDVVLQHRRHDGNLTRDNQKKERFHLLVLHKSIQRRRAQGIDTVPEFSDMAVPAKAAQS